MIWSNPLTSRIFADNKADVPFVLGIITGLILFARFLSWLLDNFHQVTIMVINGLLIASLWVIWPYQERVYEITGGKLQLVGSSPYLPEHFNGITLVILLLMVLGVALVITISHFAKKISIYRE